MSNAKQNNSKVIEFSGGPIRRTNRFFIALRSYGHCDERGKVVLGVECSSRKITSEPDRPLAVMAAILLEMSNLFDYSSLDAAKDDLEKFKSFVAELTAGESDDETGDKKGGAS